MNNNNCGVILAQAMADTFELTKIPLKIKKCREDVILPQISKGNAGIDLRVLTEDGKPVTLLPNETRKFKTGIKMGIPDGYYIEVVVRSSTGIRKNLRLMNTVGILDPSWKGETIVALHNFGTTPTTIENNERVCQMIIHKIEDVSIIETEDIGTSDRGENGIGSTGRL